MCFFIADRYSNKLILKKIYIHVPRFNNSEISTPPYLLCLSPTQGSFMFNLLYSLTEIGLNSVTESTNYERQNIFLDNGTKRNVLFQKIAMVCPRYWQCFVLENGMIYPGLWHVFVYEKDNVLTEIKISVLTRYHCLARFQNESSVFQCNHSVGQSLVQC